MKILFGVLLILHGLIVAAQSGSSFNPTSGPANPAWLSWWPVNLGQSWLFIPSGAENSPIARGLGILWLAAGLALLAAGLAVLGIIIPMEWWRTLALAGAALSIVMLAIYLHPLFGIGIGASLLILAALLIRQWPVLGQIGL
ncbi:MAG: hypothetical protein GYA15_15600 [Leptolinea sp.]|jgi:hypothetical protein|nr:hypothetical protein [Leptolinea sp.]